MSLSKPLKRTIRQFTDGTYSGSCKGAYIEDINYAEAPAQYVRAFLLLQKDLINLFEYVEPAEKNLTTYSYRIHELLIRSCVEFEANCKAILAENNYKHPKKTKEYWNIIDYQKINRTHHLSSYKVTFPVWNGGRKILNPFEDWDNNQSLSWYSAYNETKHDRHMNFEKANFEALLKAVCGVLVILSSQFYTNDFIPKASGLLLEGPDYGIGDYFEIEFPNDWTPEEQYGFTLEDWKLTRNLPNSFDNHSY